MRPKVYFSDKIKLIGTEQGIPYHDALILVLCDYYEEKARQVCKRAKADFDEVYKKDSGKIEFRAAAISESFGNLNTLEDLNRDIEMFVREDIEEENMTEENNQEQSLKCPCCGKKLEDNFYAYHCDCGFEVLHVIAGTKIEDSELEKIFAGEQSELHEFTSSKTGNPFKARLKLSADKLKVEMDFPKPEDTGLKCPHCGKRILETDKGFFCEEKDFKCWKNTRGHEISREELQKILDGQGDELDFVGKSSGKPYKGRLVLNEAKDGLDFEFADSKASVTSDELTNIVRDNDAGAGENQ